MKKLLFVISQLYKGGAETALINLLNTLDYDTYQVDLIVLNQQPESNAVSMIESVNSHVTVCNAFEEYQKITFGDRVRAKLIYSTEQKGAYWFTALDFIKGKIYDWAFFWGEWCAPSFVAQYVIAHKKAAWIHSDISSASFFDSELYFYFFDDFNYFIFVSQKSMETALEKFPFLKGKEVLIYNISNVPYIKSQAEKITEGYRRPDDRKVILTCANIRAEKNHLRQIEVMAELKRRGVNFQWINIGSTTEEKRVQHLRERCSEENLEKDFLFLGPKENPYNYMRQADMIAVLSDHESWSMVITEAKILGIPVIATKTSGALEQLIDGETGVLTNFDVNSIANRIEEYLNNEEKIALIKSNLQNFDNTKEILAKFYQLLEKTDTIKQSKQKLLYVIDDVNYMSGAHNATFSQIKELQAEDRLDITIFSLKTPSCNIRSKALGVTFTSWRNIRAYKIFSSSFLNCMCSDSFTRKEKRYRLKLTYKYRVKKEQNIIDRYIVPATKDFFSNYDLICIMSEASIFREAAANSSCKKKIQWIHTDYCAWREKTDWTRKVTAEDEIIYQKMDTIVTLSEKIRQKMAAFYPELASKIVVNKNIVPVEDIINKSKPKIQNKKQVNFITVGRIDNSSKACYRLLQILSELADEGYLFRWTLVGDGEDYDKVKDQVEAGILKDYVILKGSMKNPFLEMKKADVFALLSTYEGLPNTIYEALILGIPVVATDVGGIADQIITGETGWLVSDNAQQIKNIIIHILMHPEEITEIAENLRDYKYDNQKIMEMNNTIFNLGE